MDENLINQLIGSAKAARQHARARYSKFRVGAALATADGKIFRGCNVESSSYGLSICAERVALTKALSEGENHFTAIAVSARDGLFCPPCGACRQLLMDYAPELDVILTDGQAHKIFKIKELLPEAFEDSQLESL
jgi:cytidine deaminase